MARTITEGERRMRLFECDHCGAPPGIPCMRPTGRFTAAHGSRFVKATAAGELPLDGRSVGERDA